MRRLLTLGMCLALGGCASLVSSMTGRMAGDLEDSILNSRDVDTVREAIPAYLVLVDSFLRRSPEDEDLLLAASNLNGSFSNFTTDRQRTRLLTQKSLDYALQATCVHKDSLCGFRDLPFDRYKAVIDSLTRSDVPAVYQAGVAWAGWIQAHSDDWNAIAQLSKVKYLMAKMIDLDEARDHGGPHLYMGALQTILPASMGGEPEKGRKHFERAIELSGGRYLMTKVIYAEQYARLTFNKALHDRLLKEVINADPVAPGMTLANELAQERAKALLASSDEYF